jgi:hypothetical protein
MNQNTVSYRPASAQLVPSETIGSPKTPKSDTLARLWALPVEEVEATLSRRHRKNKPSCSLLSFLRNPDNGITRVQAAALVLQELAGGTENAATTTSLVVRYGKHQYSWGIMPILNHASFLNNDTNFWGHGDWDMLEVGNGNLTFQESRSHFALWAALKSPLIIGTPLHGIEPDILEILSNKELIDFNQDPVFGAAAKPYKWGINADWTWNQSHPAEYWSGRSSKGVHVFALNTLNATQTKAIDFAEVPELDAEAEYTVFDSWTGEKQGNFKGRYEAVVESHDTAIIRLVETSDAGYGASHYQL